MAKSHVLSGLAIGLSLSAAASADEVKCPVDSITLSTIPSLPDPWYWVETWNRQEPHLGFWIIQGKEMAACNYRNAHSFTDFGDPTRPTADFAKKDFSDYYVLVAARPMAQGVSWDSYPCPAQAVQTTITTPLPSPWEKVTYPFTLVEKRRAVIGGGFSADLRLTCLYRGPRRSEAPTTPATIVRQFKFNYPKLKSNPGPALGLAQGFGVTLVKLTTLSPSPGQTVPCPARVQMHGQIDANGPGLVQFRLVHNGVAGPAKNVNYSKAGSHAEIFNLTVEPKPPAGSGTLAQAPPPPPGVVQGLAHIEILQPTTGKKVSNDATYSLKCQVAVPGQFAAPSKPPGGR
jgi:hypothetical protein